MIRDGVEILIGIRVNIGIPIWIRTRIRILIRVRTSFILVRARAGIGVPVRIRANTNILVRIRIIVRILCTVRILSWILVLSDVGVSNGIDGSATLIPVAPTTTGVMLGILQGLIPQCSQIVWWLLSELTLAEGKIWGCAIFVLGASRMGAGASRFGARLTRQSVTGANRRLYPWWGSGVEGLLVGDLGLGNQFWLATGFVDRLNLVFGVLLWGHVCGKLWIHLFLCASRPLARVAW